MSKKNKDNIILGLDISSRSTGWAVLRNGKWRPTLDYFGVIGSPINESLPKRLVYFRNELHKLIKKIKPTTVVIEDVFGTKNIATLKLLARFNGVAVEVCRRSVRKDPVIVLAVTVRASLECGKSKQEAFKFICDKYKLSDWSFKNHNDITDAVCLVLYYNKD